MHFGKYQIIILKHKGGDHTRQMGRWLKALAVLLVAGLVAGNIWLLREYSRASHLRHELTRTEKGLEDQRDQILNLMGKLVSLTADVERVRQFDAKLRLMMNIEQDATTIGGLGGSRRADFATVFPAMHRQDLAARKMQAFLRQLEEDVRLEEVSQQALLSALRHRRDRLQAMPSIWPVEGMISSRFGGRASPFGTGWGEFHKGLDIRNRAGTPIVATAFGVVIQAGPDKAYGNSVEVDHGNGIVTKYAHMQSYVVSVGQSLKRGEILGFVGSTGRSTGPHLHYEVRLNGVPVDPMRYILN